MNILAVGAHFDDIELACGASLSLAINKGHKVYVIIVSSSDYKDYTGKILRTKEQAKEEGFKALNLLGITHIYLLDYSTKKVPYNAKIIEEINKIIDYEKIDLIITHHLNESHQDHQNTAKATISACRYKNNIWMYEPLYPSNLSNQVFKPSIYIDITSTLNNKINAIKAHKSQYKKYSKDWVDLIKARARVRGIEIKTKYAEAFEVLKMKYSL